MALTGLCLELLEVLLLCPNHLEQSILNIVVSTCSIRLAPRVIH